MLTRSLVRTTPMPKPSRYPPLLFFSQVRCNLLGVWLPGAELHIKECHGSRGRSTCALNAASSLSSDIGFISIPHHLVSQLEAVSVSNTRALAQPYGKADIVYLLLTPPTLGSAGRWSILPQTYKREHLHAVTKNQQLSSNLSLLVPAHRAVFLPSVSRFLQLIYSSKGFPILPFFPPAPTNFPFSCTAYIPLPDSSVPRAMLLKGLLLFGNEGSRISAVNNAYRLHRLYRLILLSPWMPDLQG